MINSRRQCWVCFGTDEDVRLSWLHPCKCRGTAKWVHVRCLQRWIDEKHKINPSEEVYCPQCNHLYNVIYPSMGESKLQLQNSLELAVEMGRSGKSGQSKICLNVSFD